MIDSQTGVITDIGMEIYSGTCGALTLIECDDDDSPNGLMSMISASGLTPGSTIYIRIWEFGNDNNGTFGICASTLCNAPTSISASAIPAGAIQVPTSVTFNYLSHAGGTCTGNWKYQWETSGGIVLQSWSTTSSYTTTVSSTVSYVLRMRCSSCPTSTTLSNIITIYYGVVPLNDECSGAIPVTVNLSSSCAFSTPGTIQLATASPQANDCWGTANDDVWYSFVATNSTHYIFLTNIVGSTTDLYHSVYAGNCGSIGTPLICSDPENSTITGLSIGSTYYVRVFSWFSSIDQTTTFDICINSPGPPTSDQDCQMGTTICNDQQFSGNSNGFGYQELTSANKGCLSFEHQASWYLFSPQTQGTIELSITPQNWSDDYDFAIWGPYPPGSTAADICPPSISPLRCSWSAWDGNTGLMSGAGDVSEGAGGDKWVDPITIGSSQIDAVYLMLIDNWTETYTPFTLDWTLTGVILDCTGLPVVLIKSFAECRTNGTNIQWTTTSEQNNDQFKLYRSLDNKIFTFIGSVQGSGNSNQQKSYQFSDNLSYEGDVYYRLDQIDFDGVTSQLTIMTANCTHISGFDLQSAYFDNYEEHLFVCFSGIADKQYELKLHDLAGKVLLCEEITAGNSGYNYLKLPFFKPQQSLYIVSMSNEFGISKFCKVFAK